MTICAVIMVPDAPVLQIRKQTRNDKTFLMTNKKTNTHPAPKHARQQCKDYIVKFQITRHFNYRSSCKALVTESLSLSAAALAQKSKITFDF